MLKLREFSALIFPHASFRGFNFRSFSTPSSCNRNFFLLARSSACKELQWWLNVSVKVTAVNCLASRHISHINVVCGTRRLSREPILTFRACSIICNRCSKHGNVFLKAYRLAPVAGNCTKFRRVTLTRFVCLSRHQPAAFVDAVGK